MTISVMSSTGGSAVSGGNVALVFPTTTVANDVAYVIGGHVSHAGSGGTGPTATSSFTQLILLTSTSSTNSSNCTIGVWRRVLDAATSGVTCQGTGSASDATAYITYVLRGVDTAQPEDVTVTTAVATTANPDPPAIVTARINCCIIAISGSIVNDATPGTISGYSSVTNANATDNFPMTVAGAFKNSVTIGSENPGAWSSFSAGSNASITIAVRSADGAPVTYHDMTDRPNMEPAYREIMRGY